MTDRTSAPELTQLLQETSRHHHAAYASSNGVDPEWASWYAPYLQARLGEQPGTLPTRSELVYLLVAAEKAFRHQGADAESWAGFYAAFILDNYPADKVD